MPWNVRVARQGQTQDLHKPVIAGFGEHLFHAAIVLHSSNEEEWIVGFEFPLIRTARTESL
jgi:hypothetical protein